MHDSIGNITMRVAVLCAAPFACKQLSYHFYGNYFMQTLLLVSYHARAVAPRISRSGTPEILNCASKTFGNVVGALQGDFADMAVHPQANYVIDALLEFASEEEVALVAEEMSKSFIRLVTHRWGFKLLQQAVEKMVSITELCYLISRIRPKNMHDLFNSTGFCRVVLLFEKVRNGRVARLHRMTAEHMMDTLLNDCAFDLLVFVMSPSPGSI
jgi:hypothetical protein